VEDPALHPAVAALLLSISTGLGALAAEG